MITRCRFQYSPHTEKIYRHLAPPSDNERQTFKWKYLRHLQTHKLVLRNPQAFCQKKKLAWIIFSPKTLQTAHNRFLNPTMCPDNLQSRTATWARQPAKASNPEVSIKTNLRGHSGTAQRAVRSALHRNDQRSSCMVRCYHSIAVLRDQLNGLTNRALDLERDNRYLRHRVDKYKRDERERRRRESAGRTFKLLLRRKDARGGGGWI